MYFFSGVSHYAEIEKCISWVQCNFARSQGVQERGVIVVILLEPAFLNSLTCPSEPCKVYDLSAQAVH